VIRRFSHTCGIGTRNTLGSAVRVSEKAPPARADSAARESDVTAPVPKTSILVLAIFSRVFRSGLECLESSEVYFR
jgi:hypothetical protein